MHACLVLFFKLGKQRLSANKLVKGTYGCWQRLRHLCLHGGSWYTKYHAPLAAAACCSPSTISVVMVQGYSTP